MKILCPKCGQTIVLSDLAKLGRQNSYCDRCKIYVHATYENNNRHEFWDVEYEKHHKPPDQPKGDPFGEMLSFLGYFLFTILVIVLLFLFFVSRTP
jgi:hypothetical protein